LIFGFYPLRFEFCAREPIYFPPGKSANILRGAFGLIFRRLVCDPQCRSARTCERRAVCPYARLFEPAALQPGPSGFVDWPRPFVFRATHLDARSIDAGAPFYFDLHLFDLTMPTLRHFVTAFAELAREGLGPALGRDELTSVWQLDRHHRPAKLLDENVGAPLELSLATSAEAVTHARVRFLTPTELKSGHQLAPRPEFAVLAARARDRISSLRALYGPGPLDIDFRGFGERAAKIQMTRCVLTHVAIERRSTRTGQTHPLGGFTGEAEYEGELAEFVPYLEAAQWTGVGRQTVWGKGEITLEALATKAQTEQETK